jgi:hypothetical protein
MLAFPLQNLRLGSRGHQVRYVLEKLELEQVFL